MNILIMSKIFAKSGVGSHIMDLSETLKQRGHMVTIMSGTNDHEDFLREKDIPFVSMSFSMQPVQFLKNVVEIVRIIKENKVDIVHCHHRTCAFYMNVVSSVTGVPFVWSNHLDNIPSDFIHRLTTFYGKQAICVSTDLKYFCMNKLRIPEEKITVVYNGIHPENYTYDSQYVESFRKEHQIGEKKVIGLFARMAPIKGHQHLINAVSRIPATKMRNHVVVFFGGGIDGEYVQSLKDSIQEKKIDSYFIFEGFVKPNQALSLSDITVLPSEKEGFPIVTIESFQMKVLHLRTKTAGYVDVEGCCIGVDIGDEDALAQELEKYLDGNDYSAIRQKAHEFTQQRCTVDAMTNQIIDIYQNAIKGKT